MYKFLMLTLALLATHALAASNSEATLSAERSAKKAGFYLGFASEPFPSAVSLNTAYAINDYTRLHVGVGDARFGTSVGLGAKFLLLPQYALTPTLGLSGSRTTISDRSRTFFGSKVNSPDDVFWSAAFNAGLDWAFKSGLSLALGANVLVGQEPENALSTKVFPYLNAGVFF